MTQTWDPQAYGQNGAFVHTLASGVLEWLAAKPGEYILDLGSGDGQLTGRIAITGATVLGVDASPEMIASARERESRMNRRTLKRFRSAPRRSMPFSLTQPFTGFVIRMRCSPRSGVYLSPVAASLPRWAVTATSLQSAWR